MPMALLCGTETVPCSSTEFCCCE